VHKSWLSSPESSVSSPSLRESLPKFFVMSPSHYSAVGRVNVTKCTQDSKIALEILCNGTMSEFIREKVSLTK